ncbi:GFA family protein [Pelagibacterium limicola]|uniref:GFA family protein n=1 Tax=Pelagibacterium limicola TaxID=2791022 RepID=UPI0018AFF2A0|nr:GFA family protein [Pelagibacterium limicola]
MDEVGETFSGGCQCGAIRFRVEGPVIDASVCHCRMCQKATGGLFGAYVAVENRYLQWKRGAPAHFRSSSVAQRGFCPACGTPMTFEWTHERTAIAIGCFDEPDYFTLDVAYAAENMHPAIAGLVHVPARPLADTPEAERAYQELESFQHPDNDTSTWP